MNGISNPFVIGSVTLDCPVILAPMAGVCDLPYRVIARQHGAGLVCTEMISDKGLIYGNKTTRRMLSIAPGEHPLSMQIFGSEPESMARAAAMIEEAGADIVDINMGCPVKKVVHNGSGSALMNDLPRAEAIIRAVVRAVSVPVTVKMRTGWDEEHIAAPELAKRAEQAGAAAVIVHGRTRQQFYSGRANWQRIKEVVEAVSVPVIGNGDIVDGRSAASIMNETGCKAVMIGRGAQGNPWIFREITHFLETGELLPPPSAKERCEQILRHFEALIEYKGEYIGLREMRAHASWYTKGLYGSACMRERINRAQSPEQFRDIIETSMNETEKQAVYAGEAADI